MLPDEAHDLRQTVQVVESHLKSSQGLRLLEQSLYVVSQLLFFLADVAAHLGLF